ncbi:hypothetical protein [Cellulomonas sp. NS3]|uniref:hypothetical protein n=1 Tax=Cellulomonas sp. NS3 TaxID=2973977 RepID=UPI00216313D6|nr:hypothetical protein [Cellulomonas sp. NS3]
MSAGTGHGPDDDALPDDFTVPDDLSGLFDAPDAPDASEAPAADPRGPATAEPGRDVPAGSAGRDGSAPGAGGAEDAPGSGHDEAAPTPLAAAGRGPDDRTTDDDPSSTVPDDLASLTDPGAAEAPSVTLVLTQVAAAAPLAAACALAGVAVDVVPSPVGALAVLREPRTGPDGAAAISKLLKTVPVILLERRSGQITATRWAGGQKGDELPAGLVLSDAPPVLEELLLGGASVSDVEGVVTSVGLSRWKAMRLLAQSARGTRG